MKTYFIVTSILFHVFLGALIALVVLLYLTRTKSEKQLFVEKSDPEEDWKQYVLEDEDVPGPTLP